MSHALSTLDVSIDQKIDAAKAAGIIPRNMNNQAALGVVLMARELGISEIRAFGQIDVIQGVPTLRAQGMLGLAYKRLPGFQMVIVESDSDKCKLKMRRGESDPWAELTYTIAQAQKAGLTSKSNWKNHPDDMLRNRCVAKLLRMVAPDVFAGVYTPDEAEDIKTRTVEAVDVTTRAQAVEDRLGLEAGRDDLPPPEEDPCLDWLAAMDSAKTREDFKRTLAEIDQDDNLDSTSKDRLREAAKSRMVREGWTKKSG